MALFPPREGQNQIINEIHELEEMKDEYELSLNDSGV